MIDSWERCVPVFEAPLRTRSLAAMMTLGAMACLMAIYREVAGLGPASGMNDAYAWGVWKTFNVMVLTGLGSGSFAVGLAVWLFGQHRLHTVVRTAVLSSFLTYASGLTVLGVDLGRPWNFFSIAMPWRWNAHSPMLEIAFCMPLYTAVPLFIENIPALLDWMRERWPELEPAATIFESVLTRVFPLVLGLGLVLPALHQSSLGALMLLAGDQVHPLWQTPLLPLLYLGTAIFMGFAFVSFILIAAHLAWKCPLDMDVLSLMCRATAWTVASWILLRMLDVTVRGVLPTALIPAAAAGLFWCEMLLLSLAFALLVVAARDRSARLSFVAAIATCCGGMLYRFDPTTLVYKPALGAFYFPSLVELTTCIGFVAIAIAAFNLAAKVFSVLPASSARWFQMQAACGQEIESVGLAADGLEDYVATHHH